MDSQLHYWVESAWDWLIYRYDNISFEDYLNNPVTLHFHKRYSSEGYDKARCTVHWKEYQESINKVDIFLIKDIDHWSTYRRKSVGIYAPTMRVSHKFALQAQAVHELTHYIQAMQGRNFLETETTFNELKFAFDTNYRYFEQCKVIMDQRYNTTENIKCII